MQTLKNDILSIAVNNHGAELTSIKKNGVEYLWQADPAFWKRHSPVLFPIVGSVWDGNYTSTQECSVHMHRAVVRPLRQSRIQGRVQGPRLDEHSRPGRNI